jgi:NTP pyrophosphatase (non-canonical NTP hydrolase)
VKELQDRIGRWQRGTFPESTSLSKIEHTELELVELSKEIKSGTHEGKSNELADCFILLLGIADLEQIDIEKAIEKKFEEIQKRTWGKASPTGVYFHEKEVVNE